MKQGAIIIYFLFALTFSCFLFNISNLILPNLVQEMNHPAKSMLTGSNLQLREASRGYFSYSGSDETLVSRIRNNGDKHKGTNKP